MGKLKLVLGRAGSGKTYYCYRAIRDTLAADPLRYCLMVVPDQASYTAERALAAFTAERGIANAEVLGFARLAYRIFGELGTDTGASLSVLGQQLVLRRILQAEKEQLQVLGRAARQPHFAEVLMAELTELIRYRVGPADLLRPAENVSGSLAAKLKDAARLYAAYADYVDENFPGALRRHDLLVEEIARSELLRKASLWIDGFVSFTPRDWEVVSATIRRADEATLTLALDPEDLPAAARETSVFHRQWQIRRRLHEEFPDLEEIYLTGAPRFAPAGGLADLEAKYFAVPPQTAPQPLPGLRLTEAHSREEEVETILCEICRLVREEGYRWRDITILLRTHTDYTDHLIRACERFDVPYFTDARRPMCHDGLTVLLTEAAYTAVHGLRTDAIMRMLKTGLLPIANEAAEELELYCREFGIEAAEWNFSERWEYRERRNIESEEEVAAEIVAQWERIDAVRRRITSIFTPLIDAFKGKHTVREYATALFHWLETTGIRELLIVQADEAEEEEYRARLQVYGRVIDLLDEITAVAGDEVWSAEDFALIWSDGLATLSYSLIPPTLDHVTITTIERGYVADSKIIFVPGQNEGVFPAHPVSDGLWTDGDREELRRYDLDIGPDSVRMVLRERHWLYLAWTRAKEKLYLSYAVGGDEGEAMEPAFALRRLAQNGYASIETASFDDPAAAWVRPRQSLAELPAALTNETISTLWYALYDWALAGEYRDMALAWTRSLFYRNAAKALDPELGKRIYAPHNFFIGSVTAFETYRRCPFRFYARYGLRLDEVAEQELTKADFGTYLHAGLHRFGAELLAENRQWRDVTEEEIERKTRTIADDIAPRLGNDVFARNAYHGYIRYRLDLTFAKTVQRLAQWAKQGKFSTLALEEPFRIEAGEVDGTKFIMTGFIDRLDIYHDPETGRDYYLVIDYKTGKTEIDIEAIYYGLRLQLATYLYAALRSDGENESMPAGIMYVYVRDERHDFGTMPNDEKREKKIREDLRAQGYFLAERQILGYIDAETGTEISFLPVRFNKDGSFSKRNKNIVTAEDMNTIVDFIATELPAICAEILSGDIAIEPVYEKGGPVCRYCPYKRFCAFDYRVPGNRYRRPKKLAAEDALAKMKMQTEGGADDALD